MMQYHVKSNTSLLDLSRFCGLCRKAIVGKYGREQKIDYGPHLTEGGQTNV